MENQQQQLLEEFLDQWHTGNGIKAHTSGSTGTPKVIILPQSQVLRSAQRSIRYFGITKSSRLHSAMSFAFIGGKMMIARSLVSGCELTFSEPALCLEPPKGEKDITLMCAVPAQLPYILDNLEKFKIVKGYLIGGSAIDDRLWDRIVASGINAWESYGMTETATHVAMRRIAGNSARRPRFVPLPGIKISLGPDSSIHIKDEDVVVLTTDLAKMHPDGSFEIIGRKDDMINTGGIKVLPQEIEKAIQDFINPYVEAFYISSVPDIVWTSRLILVAVPKAGSDPTELHKFLSKIIQEIPFDIIEKKKLPKEVRIIEELPRTQSGKLNRRFKFEEEPFA